MGSGGPRDPTGTVATLAASDLDLGTEPRALDPGTVATLAASDLRETRTTLTDPDSTSSPPLSPEEALGLLERARAARANAYSPYSGYSVGAALLDAAGRIHAGANVENASYGLATCAERTAVVRAVADGIRSFRAIAITGPEGGAPCLPCGSCRQLLHEFAPGMSVVVEEGGGQPRIIALGDLLPEAFGPGDLGRPSGGVE